MFSVSSFVSGSLLGFATTAVFYWYREFELKSKIFFLHSEMEAQELYVNALKIRLENKESQ